MFAATNYVQIIKDSVGMKELVQSMGIQLNYSDFARCPFHNEDTGSFKVYADHAHCFGCGWSGDAIKFVSDFNGYAFKDAVRYINDMFALGLAVDRPLTISERLSAERKYKERMILLQEERAKAEAYEALYDFLWTQYAVYDKWKRELAPKTPDDPIDERYIKAVQNIDRILYRIDTEL